MGAAKLSTGSTHFSLETFPSPRGEAESVLALSHNGRGPAALTQLLSSDEVVFCSDLALQLHFERCSTRIKGLAVQSFFNLCSVESHHD